MYCLIYLDDVITYSIDELQHLKQIRIIFDRFRAEHLKLKPSKCKMFQSEITYFTHCGDKDRIRPSEEHLKVILEYPEPDSCTSRRQFIGMVGHFRRFVANFSKILWPLHLHLEGDASKLKAQKVKLSWNAKESFNLLKQAFLTTSILMFASYSKPFVLETDASSNGLVAALLQEGDDGKLHPIVYGSRSLTKAECNYHSGKLEFLCAKWAVTNQFKEYLLYWPFMIRAHNNPLMYIATTPNLDTCGH